MDFLKLNHCHVVDTEGGGILTLQDAVVVANGDSVTISRYNGHGRLERIDRLVEVDDKVEANGSFTFSGRSTIHLPEMQLKDDAQVAYRVTPGPGCKDCR